MVDHITLFLRYLTEQKRLSPHTVSNYQRDLQQLATFCANKQLSEWSAVQSEHIRQFIAQRHRAGLTARSIQRLLSASRSFFRFLVQQGQLAANPAQLVQAPKAAQPLPNTFDIDQITSLLTLPTANNKLACRDKAIMELFYSSGLRLAELAGLNLLDLDIADQRVRVTGKGNKQRIVPVGSQAINALNHWLSERQSWGGWSETALFISRRGLRLSPRAIQKRLHYWGCVQNISDRVHPHRFRHAFASHLLESSADLRAVQELLGHSDISSTQIYTHLDFQQLTKTYDNAHPRARKTK